MSGTAVLFSVLFSHEVQLPLSVGTGTTGLAIYATGTDAPNLQTSLQGNGATSKGPGFIVAVTGMSSDGGTVTLNVDPTLVTDATGFITGTGAVSSSSPVTWSELSLRDK